MAQMLGSGHPIRKGAPVPDGRVFPKLVGGDPAVLALYCPTVVRLVPGTLDPNEAAARLAEQFAVPMEEAQGVLPAGSVAFEGGP
jgi:hypothetical protein